MGASPNRRCFMVSAPAAGSSPRSSTAEGSPSGSVTKFRQWYIP